MDKNSYLNLTKFYLLHKLFYKMRNDQRMKFSNNQFKISL